MKISPELIGYLAAILTTFSFAPQALMTLRTRDTRTLSLAMYSMFTCGVCVWLYYGVLRGDWVIILANIVTLMLAVPILSVKVFNRLYGREAL